MPGRLFITKSYVLEAVSIGEGCVGLMYYFVFQHRDQYRSSELIGGKTSQVPLPSTSTVSYLRDCID